MDSGWDSLIPGTKEPQISACERHLLDAWLVRVEQRPSLHMFGHQAAAHAGDVLPVPQGTQRHVLVCRLPLTCGCRWVSGTHGLSRTGNLCWARLRGTKRPWSHHLSIYLLFTVGETEAQGENWLAQVLSCPIGPSETCVPGFALPGKPDQRIPLGREGREGRNPLPGPVP